MLRCVARHMRAKRALALCAYARCCSPPAPATPPTPHLHLTYLTDIDLIDLSGRCVQCGRCVCGSVGTQGCAVCRWTCVECPTQWGTTCGGSGSHQRSDRHHADYTPLKMRLRAQRGREALRVMRRDMSLLTAARYATR